MKQKSGNAPRRRKRRWPTPNTTVSSRGIRWEPLPSATARPSRGSASSTAFRATRPSGSDDRCASNRIRRKTNVFEQGGSGPLREKIRHGPEFFSLFPFFSLPWVEHINYLPIFAIEACPFRDSWDKPRFRLFNSSLIPIRTISINHKLKSHENNSVQIRGGGEFSCSHCFQPRVKRMTPY